MPSYEDIERSIQIILQEQAAMREQIKTIFMSIREQKELTESVHTLALTVRDLANEQKNMSCNVSSVQKDVDDLKDRPGKRWDTLTTVVLTVVITAMLTYFFARLGV